MPSERPAWPRLQELVVGTINRLLEAACKQVGAHTAEIYKVTVAGNTTMMHLLLASRPTASAWRPSSRRSTTCRR